MENESIRKAEFDAVYEAHKDSVYQTALLYTRHPHAAEDIMQEAFLKYYIYTECNRVESVKGWLMTTARNMARNYIRDHRRETPVDLKETKVLMFSPERSTEDLFFKRLWKGERLDITYTILHALNGKNVKWHRAVTLVYCMEYSYREAAECMEITEDALDGILRRAKKWIKEDYEEEYNHIVKR